MAWSTIRRASVGDEWRLAEAAERFVKRHGLAPEEDERSAVEIVEFALSSQFGWSEQQRQHIMHLRRLWTQVVHRALRSQEATGIAGGYVGFEAC